jgi:hypothetical protein
MALSFTTVHTIERDEGEGQDNKIIMMSEIADNKSI